MRLSADAKAYAAGVDVSQFDAFLADEVRRLVSEAFQHGYDHHKASQRRLEKLAKGKA